MITKDNIRDILVNVGFSSNTNGTRYSKAFNTCSIVVDFAKK